MSSPDWSPVAIQSLLRELAPQVLGAALRRFGDLDSTEDAVQEALLAAFVRWPETGVPQHPRAWVLHVAARRLVDHIRASTARRRREGVVASAVPGEDQIASSQLEDLAVHDDDPLSLMLLCCHESLSPSSAVALTLRAVGGLTTAEIARAFMVPETTMGQRISRAKQKIRACGARFERPSPQTQARRLPALLHVLYLVFSEGYVASDGPELMRIDLSTEAIRMTRLLCSMLPDDAEAKGLLALMLLTDARSPARAGPSGELIPLDEQDRSLWNADQIAEGLGLVQDALRTGPVGSYQVQAAIAALHDEAESFEATDWPQILALYETLLRLADNPMFALSHVVALAMVHGPAAGLQRLADLENDPRLAEHHRLHAVRGHLLVRAGDPAGAIDAFERAAAGTTSAPEREYLWVKLARLRQML